MSKPRLKESPGTSLVVSFLVRYPELSSLRYNPDTERLAFRIFLKGVVELTQQEEFRQYVEAYLAACRELDPAFSQPGLIEFVTYEGATELCYKQQIHSLQLAEVRLFMELVRQYYAGMLGDDLGLPPHEEDATAHDELIERILQNKSAIREEKPIVGYREGGRVFVFNR